MVKVLLVTDTNYELKEVERRSLLGYKWDKYKSINGIYEIYIIYARTGDKNKLASLTTKTDIYGDAIFVRMNPRKMVDILIEHIPELHEAYTTIINDMISAMNISDTSKDDVCMQESTESKATYFNNI